MIFRQVRAKHKSMNRTNWYDDHPPACTCAGCQKVHEHKTFVSRKIGRNEKCPCGSGKKYKRCHGA